MHMKKYKNRQQKAKQENNILRAAVISRQDNAKKRAKKRGYTALNATLEEIEQALEVCCCECCGKLFEQLSEKYLDHCHESGDLRGVLCQACNLIEGLAVDEEHLHQVMNYMKKVR